MTSRIRAWIKLCSAPGIGAGKAIKLVYELGEPEGYIDRLNTPLRDISYISEPALSFLESDCDPPEWKKISKLIESSGINFLTILDERYPEMLRKISNPPIWLFYLGDFKDSDFLRNIAVVGTRRPSNYGKGQCIKITGELVKRGFTIVSGLAYGVDALAHRAALDNNGRTIAVLGCGLDQVYPPAHHNLAEEIQKNGVILSEQLPGSKINPWNFANRNRIISGLSHGSWIVEGKVSSGAMITARDARQQQRVVFALPGDISRENSQGPNKLISEGSIAVLGYESILSGLGIMDSDEQMTIEGIDDLNEQEKRIYKLLLAEEELNFDQLMVKSGVPLSKLSTLLLSLELKGLVRKAAGNKIYPIK